MYRRNKLPRPVLCTVDEILAMAPIDQEADIRYLQNSIIAAEERWIVPALGQNLYTDLVSQKNQQVTILNQAAMLVNINDSLTAAGKQTIVIGDLPIGMWVNAIDFCAGNYQSLWNMFLWQICAEAVTAMAMIPAWSRMTGQGVENNNPKTLTGEGQGAQTVGIKTMEKILDNAYQQRIKPLIARMQEWICDAGTYTLFTGCPKKGVASQTRGGIISGLYDDYNPNGANLWQLGDRFGDRCRDDRNNNCGGQGAPAPIPPYTPPVQTVWRSIKVWIKAVPDNNKLIAVGGGRTIQAEYAPGATVTPMKIGDAGGYLANRPFFNTITLDDGAFPDDDYDSTTGIFSGGFTDGMYIKITFLDNA